jgi:Enoyl-(Acyl carrier protein) reductase
VAQAFKGINAMPIAWAEPEDISEAVLFLVSDSGRYVSGTQLSVDAGAAAKSTVSGDPFLASGGEDVCADAVEECGIAVVGDAVSLGVSELV